jgi:regulatory protein
MTLTCGLKAGSKQILIVSLNGEPYAEAHTAIFGKNPKFKSVEEFREEEYRGAKRYALKRLSMQAMLSTALSDALRERLVSESVIEKVISECLESGYIDDKEWVDAFVRGQKRKRVGPEMIRMKLVQKGVDPSLMEEEVDESAQIRDLLESRFRNRNLRDYKEKQKVIAALMRKGYHLGAILNEMPK